MSDLIYSGELYLVYAVIRRAVWDALRLENNEYAFDAKAKNKLARAALTWLESDKDVGEPMSCRWCCEQLNITQRQLLKALDSLKGTNLRRLVLSKGHYGSVLYAMIDDDMVAYEPGRRRA